MTIKFSVLGEPRGKGRPRFGRTKNGGVRTWTPRKTADYENLIRWEYHRQCKGLRFNDSDMLIMSVAAYFGIPKNASKRKQEAMTAGDIMPLRKPDVDNILKVVADSLNGIAYRDDSQIVSVTVRKRYCTMPRIEVGIWRV